MTTGRAGGFANAQFRARVANQRAANAGSQNTRVRKGVKVAAAVAGTAAAGAATRAVVGGRPGSRKVEISNPGKKGNALSNVVRTVGKIGKSLN